MRPIRVAFLKMKVLLIGRDSASKGRVWDSLKSFGVHKNNITDCKSCDNLSRRALYSYDLIVFDCPRDRFSQELAFDEFISKCGNEKIPAPIVFIAHDDPGMAIELAIGDHVHTVIKPSFCAKSLYLKLHLLFAKFRSSLADDRMFIHEDPESAEGRPLFEVPI